MKNLQHMIDELAAERRRVEKMRLAAEVRCERLSKLANELEDELADPEDSDLSFEEKQAIARYDRLIELANKGNNRDLDLKWRGEKLKKAQDALDEILEASS